MIYSILFLIDYKVTQFTTQYALHLTNYQFTNANHQAIKIIWNWYMINVSGKYLHLYLYIYILNVKHFGLHIFCVWPHWYYYSYNIEEKRNDCPLWKLNYHFDFPVQCNIHIVCWSLCMYLTGDRVYRHTYDRFIHFELPLI